MAQRGFRGEKLGELSSMFSKFNLRMQAGAGGGCTRHTGGVGGKALAAGWHLQDGAQAALGSVGGRTA